MNKVTIILHKHQISDVWNATVNKIGTLRRKTFRIIQVYYTGRCFRTAEINTSARQKVWELRSASFNLPWFLRRVRTNLTLHKYIYIHISHNAIWYAMLCHTNSNINWQHRRRYAMLCYTNNKTKWTISSALCYATLNKQKNTTLPDPIYWRTARALGNNNSNMIYSVSIKSVLLCCPIRALHCPRCAKTP